MIALMGAAYKTIIAHKKISWLLIATILLVTLQPAHYHLHHATHDKPHNNAAVSHEHVVDFHVLTDQAGHLHHDDGTTIIVSAPDGIMKKSHSDFLPFILLAVVLLLRPVLNRQTYIQLNFRNTALKQDNPYSTPLLRAPPLQ